MCWVRSDCAEVSELACDCAQSLQQATRKVTKSDSMVCPCFDSTLTRTRSLGATWPCGCGRSYCLSRTDKTSACSRARLFRGVRRLTIGRHHCRRTTKPDSSERDGHHRTPTGASTNLATLWQLSVMVVRANGIVPLGPKNVTRPCVVHNLEECLNTLVPQETQPLFGEGGRWVAKPAQPS